jgi:predicted ATP-dependent endonuclease of OLD family
LRRFGGKDEHRVRIDAKMVCLIGANEAGKSTVLDALEFARQAEAIPPAARSRGESIGDDRTIVRLQYRLDDADRAALASIVRDADGPQEVQWFTVEKQAGARYNYYAVPELIRDRAPRRSLHATLVERGRVWWPHTPPVEVGDQQEQTDEVDPDAERPFAPDQGRVHQVVKALDSDKSTLPDAVSDQLRELVSELDPHDPDLATQLRQLADLEQADPPDVQADNLLWQRTPQFVRFDERARQLDSEYDINSADASAGTAFSNLVQLAELELDRLRVAIANGETGTVRDIREAANETLKHKMVAWQQNPPITVSLETEGSLLRIHVKSGSGPTMAFRERSDGLRQFVALIALAAHQPNPVPPILMIDEIETHLHYNAQADLIEVLTEQTAIHQIVYTTHSAACLPQDLGLGVRVVEGLGERTASIVRQNFWRDEQPGLAALLMAMGASSLVFVTMRPAVIAEGGSDLVLLPTLFREAIGSSSLGFAIVPGAATTPPHRIAGLDLQGVATVWVLDADDSGRTRREQLIENSKIPEERVLLLADDGDIEIEDLISPETYAAAVQNYLKDIGTADEFDTSHLPRETCQRHETVQAWCHERQITPPSKIVVSNKIIDLVHEAPILDEQLAEMVRDLHDRIAALFPG